MNERIKELLAEAKIYDGSKTQDLITCPEDLEKFTELIVRECTAVGSQWADGLIDENHYAFVNKKIKQHFGVEE
jgi:hypothetical protein